MTVKLGVFLAIGTVLMGVPMGSVARRYGYTNWKWICITVLLTVCGALGTFVMYFVENGIWGGLSFYGAVFLVPVLFLPVTWCMRLPYNKTMDLCAVGECIMLALMKVHCLISGCCKGRLLWTTAEGADIIFPSREAELVVALLIFLVLFLWARKEKMVGTLYGWFLILYGSTRFVLNIFRQAWVEKTMLLPIGNIWSIVAVVIGLVWILLLQRRKAGKLR